MRSNKSLKVGCEVGGKIEIVIEINSVLNVFLMEKCPQASGDASILIRKTGLGKVSLPIAPDLAPKKLSPNILDNLV